jgi:hypothetical protein
MYGVLEHVYSVWVFNIFDNPVIRDCVILISPVLKIVVSVIKNNNTILRSKEKVLYQN